MSKFKLFMTALLVIAIGFVNFSSCKYNSNDIDQPLQTEYAPPVVQPLKLSKSVKINWGSIKTVPINSKEGESSEFIISLPFS